MHSKNKANIFSNNINKKVNNLFNNDDDKQEINFPLTKTDNINKNVTITSSSNENKKLVPKNNSNLFADFKESPKDLFAKEPVIGSNSTSNNTKQTNIVNSNINAKAIKTKPPVVNKTKTVNSIILNFRQTCLLNLISKMRKKVLNIF